MLIEDDVLITGDYYTKLPKLLASSLYDCFDMMPKTVIHHIHLTAACPISFLIKKLCYYDFVYFNQKENMFKVNKNGISMDGYVKVNDLRSYWENSSKFDEYLNEIILLNETTIKC
jgi:hypothetical protein